MSVPFRRSQQRQEQEEMTPEKIVRLAGRAQGICVSWRYRDEWLMKRCGDLVKAGLLRKERGGKGATVFLAKASAGEQSHG